MQLKRQKKFMLLVSPQMTVKHFFLLLKINVKVMQNQASAWVSANHEKKRSNIEDPFISHGVMSNHHSD